MRRHPRAFVVSLLTSGLVLSAGLALSGSASAQSIRAAALVPQIKTGGATPEIRDKFHDAVTRGLSGLAGPSGPNGELGEVLSGAEARSRLGEELLTCGGMGPCLPKALAALRVNRLITSEISVIGKTYTLGLRLYDGNGRELTHAEDICEICTVREADEALGKAAARLAAAARTFPVEPVPGLERDKAKEPKPAPREEPKPEPTSKVSPMQEPPAPPPSATLTEKPRSHFPWRPVAFASLGLGIVGLAIGIPLLVIDGRPTCDLPDPERACPEVYNTAGGGATMVAIGAIGLVATIPLFYFDYRNRHRAVSSMRLRTTPLLGGGAFVFEGRF